MTFSSIGLRFRFPAKESGAGEAMAMCLLSQILRETGYVLIFVGEGASDRRSSERSGISRDEDGIRHVTSKKMIEGSRERVFMYRN